MKQYNVEYVPRLLKKLSKLDAPVLKQIKSWIDKNLEGCSDPRRKGIPLLENFGRPWRFRTGEYRIIAKILDDKSVVLVVKIDKRGDVYE